MSESIARRTRVAMTQQVLGLVMMVGFAVASARWLGPAGKGVLTLVTTGGVVAGSVFGLGVPQALTAWVSRDRLTTREALFIGVVFAALVTVVLAGVARLGILPSTPAWQFLWLATGVTLFEQAVSGTSNGAGILTPQLLLRSVGGGLQVVAMLVAWLIAFPPTLGAVLSAYFVPGLIGVTVALVALVRQRPEREAQPKVMLASLGPMAAFGLAVIPAQLLSVTNYKLDVLLLGALSGTEAVGIYSLAVSATLLVGMLPSAFGQALTRTFGTSDDPREALKRGMHASIVTGLGSAVVLAAASPLMVPLVFGSGFAPASLLIAIMVPTTALFATVQVTFPFFYNHVRKPIVHSLVIGVTAAIDVVLLLLLAPRMGSVGAAIASAVAYTVGAALNVGVTARASGLKVTELVFPTREDFAWMARTANDWLVPSRRA